MTIINAEFVTLEHGDRTIRVTDILYLSVFGRYVILRPGGDDNTFGLTESEAIDLHRHWIRVISDRMGIYHEPVVGPSVAPPAQVEQDDAERYSPNIIAAMKRYGWSDAQFEELVDWMCRFDPGLTKRQRVARVAVAERAVIEDMSTGYEAFCVARKAITDFVDGVPA